ncbi:TonB-dependent siderophore receptor [Comamonas sp. CMM03]|uniref:TonB-dependent siderophore receptor n=1 Tax=Comamonas sp. CMM03 TaxID=2854781 RepID=UPI001C45BD5F|nr:TonB-dependent siderophore receptor [Comamonas sp. CMM03]MBV7417861.1 TonB-dependent siderophore receptor [Comamonas sp. CMM03]
MPAFQASRPVFHPVAHAVRLVLLGCALAAGAAHAADPVPATTPMAAQSYQIPAGPLGRALAEVAAAAGVALSFDPALTQGLSSPGVAGSFTPQAALQRLLAGSGLELVPRPGGSYTLQKQPQPSSRNQEGATLAEVRVTANAEPRDATEGTGSYTARRMRTATPLALSPRETPQAVSVVTSQQIEDRGLVSLADAVQATPGLTVSKWGGERYRFSSRGFQINNLMVDGLPMEYEEAALSTGALSMYDRLEVMRGAAGLSEGAGTPGGSINLVRKRPTREFQGSATVSAGSWDDYTGSVDLGGPLNEAGTLRGRAVVSRQDRHSFIDDYQNRRTLAYGILEADLAPSTTVSLGASYSNEDNPGVDWNGLGTMPDGSFLPIRRSTRMSPSWSFWDKRSTTVFADVEHRLGNGWKAKFVASAIDSEMHMLGTYLRSATIDAGGQPLFSLGGGGYDYERTQRSFDGQLSGVVTAWGRSHDVVVGASHRRSRWDDVGGGATIDGSFTLATFNPLNWDPRSVPLPTVGAYGLWRRKADMEQTSVYGMTRLAVTDATKLIVGSRLDWYERNQVQFDGDYPYGETHQKASHKFTPYAGVVHALSPTHAVYGSWTRIFNPQSYNTADGGTLAPEQGRNLELGIKGEYLDGRLNASAALFQIDLENLPDALPSSACTGQLTTCYQPAGKVRSRGVEFEVAGELARGWQMSASYTYASAKRVAAASGYDPTGSYSVGSRYATNMPRYLFKLATSYQLSGALHRWKVGGSVHVQDSISSTWNVRQGGYALVGLHAAYALSRQLDLSLNVNNLFDRSYYSGIGADNGPNFFGDPRNVMLTARYRF